MATLHASDRRGPSAKPNTCARVVGIAFVAAAAWAVPFGEQPTTLPQSVEVKISKDPARWSGEPVIAVNPKNPTNLVMSNTSIPANRPGVKMLKVREYARCHLGVSFDRGQTWTYRDLPPEDLNESNGDGAVAAGPDGAMYVVCTDLGDGSRTEQQNFGPFGRGPAAGVGETVFLRSTDGGKSWSQPVVVIGKQFERFAASVPKVLAKNGSPGERPWINVDQSTGTIYVSSGAQTEVGGTRVRLVTASHDKGRTWGAVYPTDSADYVQMAGGTTDAANGTFATAYTASKVPDPGVTCPCMVLANSKDGRASFSHRVVPVSRGSSGPQVAADLAQPGRYAVMVTSQDATRLEVYVTKDSGKTWSPRASLGEAPPNPRSRPWIAYSPKGVLGVMWRTTYRDKSYDVMTAISLGGDGRFAQPVKVSHRKSPAPLSGDEWIPDDYSSVTLDSHFVHIGWSDWRSGNLDSWYGRLPLSVFGSAKAGD